MRILLYIFLLVNLAALAGNEPELPDESVEICPSVMQSTTLTSLSLTIIATEMVFNFYFLSDYTNGLGANHDHYFSVSVDSNVRWELGCFASSDLLHSNGINNIPINQVGIEIDLVGNFGNNKIKNNAKSQPKALQLSEYILLEPRNQNVSNAGDDLDNAFVFYWEMGTGNGNMNNADFESAGYPFGQYQTTVNFILRELL